MKKYILISVILFFPFFTEGASLMTKEVDKIDSEKSYSLILYGNRHFNDIETVAIFDVEGDEYTFDPFAPDFDYSIKKGLSSERAMNLAEIFVRSHYAYRTSQISKILDKKGNVIGYELRPLYYPLVFGVSDVIDVDYWQKNGKIKITIKLKPSVERQIHDIGDSTFNIPVLLSPFLK